MVSLFFKCVSLSEITLGLWSSSILFLNSQFQMVQPFMFQCNNVRLLTFVGWAVTYQVSTFSLLKPRLLSLRLALFTDSSWSHFISLLLPVRKYSLPNGSSLRRVLKFELISLRVRLRRMNENVAESIIISRTLLTTKYIHLIYLFIF